MSETGVKMDDIRHRAQELREAIELHNYNYYTLDAPVISDAEYDKLWKQKGG